MEDQREVFVLSGTRTAIGKYGGGLASVPPCDLAATVVREAVSRAGVEPTDVDAVDLHAGRDHVGPGRVEVVRIGAAGRQCDAAHGE